MGGPDGGCADGARGGRQVHYAGFVLLDGISGTDFGAGRVFAVHAHGGGGLSRYPGVEVVEVDERRTAVGTALLAGLHACFAADATARR